MSFLNKLSAGFFNLWGRLNLRSKEGEAEVVSYYDKGNNAT